MSRLSFGAGNIICHLKSADFQEFSTSFIIILVFYEIKFQIQDYRYRVLVARLIH